MDKSREQEILFKLFDLGHFFNPTYFKPGEVKREDVTKLTFKNKLAKSAVKSWQEMMVTDLDRLSHQHHGRIAQMDGDVGPATLESFDLPRCGVADYNQGFQAAVGFPRSCAATGITYSVNKSGMPSKFNNTWEDRIVGRVRLNYATFGVRLVPYSGDNPKRANIPTIFRFLPGSTIGLTYFNQGSCSDVCDCSLDSGFAPSEAAEADLVAHEWGHAIGLGHTRGGVMNPSLGSVSEPWQGFTKNDPSWPTLTRLYGGEPLDPIPTPDGEFEFRNGIFYLDNKEVGKLNVSGSVTYMNGDVIFGGSIRGRMIMIPPA